MKKLITPLAILVFVFASSGWLAAGQNQEDAKFQKFLDEYFDAHWKFFPTAGTMAGFTKYSDKLEDINTKNTEKRQDELDQFNQDLVAKIDRLALSPDMQIDHDLMMNALELELTKFENLLPWEYDPRFYNDIFMNAVKSLLENDGITGEARTKGVTERLKKIPDLVKQAKENLKTPPSIYTETAISQMAAIMNYYTTTLPAAGVAGAQENLSKAVAALEDYGSFLSNELLPRSSGNFRLAEAHARMMRVSLLNILSIQDLAARAQADINNIKREMFLVTIPFYKIMEPRFNIEQPPSNLTEDQVKNTTISHVLDYIKVEHPSKEGFLDAVKTQAAEIKDFLTTQEMVDLPGETIAIESTSPEQLSNSWISLMSPGLYSSSLDFVTSIKPFADDLSEENLKGLLEEYNNSMLPYFTAHSVYPGPVVPALIARKNATLVRKYFPNMPVIMGWPLMLEEDLILSGYGDYDLRARLNQLKLKLKTAVNFIVEFNTHQGSWEKEQAMAYMTRVGFQSEAEAERVWSEILLHPGYTAYPYIGYQEFLDLEKEYKQLKGDSFSKREFMAKVLSFGALPFRHLKPKVLEQ